MTVGHRQTITQPLKVCLVEVTLVERKLTEPDPVRLLNVPHCVARSEGWAPPRRTRKSVLRAAAVPSRATAQNILTLNALGIAP